MAKWKATTDATVEAHLALLRALVIAGGRIIVVDRWWSRWSRIHPEPNKWEEKQQQKTVEENPNTRARLKNSNAPKASIPIPVVRRKRMEKQTHKRKRRKRINNTFTWLRFLSVFINLSLLTSGSLSFYYSIEFGLHTYTLDHSWPFHNRFLCSFPLFLSLHQLFVLCFYYKMMWFIEMELISALCHFETFGQNRNRFLNKFYVLFVV